MTGSFGLKSVGSRVRRRPLFITLAVAATALVPAAIAWACVPSAAIGFDSPSYTYNPGQTVTVTGRQWQPARTGGNVNLSVTPNPGITHAITAAPDDVGFFRTSFQLPASTQQGTYNVVAQQGTRVAREAFEVRVGAPSSRAALARAKARCKKRYRTRGRRGAARRRMARKRQACIRRAVRRHNAAARG